MVKAALISQGSKSSQWTLEAMKKYFDEVDDISLDDIELNFSGKTAELLYKNKPFPKYDCIYAKGSFRYSQLLRSLTTLLEGQCFMPITPSAFTISHDKLLTQLLLQQHQIPMPRTYITATIEAARKVLENLNYPIIMKFPTGTQGKGVMFADSFASASSILDALSSLKQSFIIQEFIDTGNTDIRALVVGNKVVASMVRKGKPEEQRANIHVGAVGENYLLDSETKDICIKAARATGADICGIDLLESPKGHMVIETNVSPGLQGITKATKVDVADKIASYLYEATIKALEQKDIKKKKDIMTDVNEEGHILTTLDFRGSKILLPEIVAKSTKISPNDEVEMTLKKGNISITKIDIN